MIAASTIGVVLLNVGTFIGNGTLAGAGIVLLIPVGFTAFARLVD